MPAATHIDRDRAVAALDEVWSELLALGGELGDADWDLPTACPGWSVRDNYSHCLGTESMLLGRPNPDVELPADQSHIRNDIGRVNELWVESYRARPGPEVLADLRTVVAERRRALAGMDQDAFDESSWTPAGQDTYGRFMRIRVMDQWTHEQDVREATGRPGHLEGLAPEMALAEVTSALGYVVGKRAGAPAGSSVRFALTGPIAGCFDVEVADRARVVEALAGDPTVTLTLPGDRFMRLAAGRVATGEVADGVDVDGDDALGDDVLGALGYMV